MKKKKDHLPPWRCSNLGKSTANRRLGPSAPHRAVEPDVVESNAGVFQTSAFCWGRMLRAATAVTCEYLGPGAPANALHVVK